MKKLLFLLFLLSLYISSNYINTNRNLPVLASNINMEVPDTFYPITGDSPGLSQKERNALEISRRKTVELAKANKGTVFINGPTSKKAVALTFDDGPDAVVTPGILDVLKNNNVKASFFFIGNILAYYPEVVKRADREGQLVLSHSFSHEEFSKLTTKEITNELNKTDERIFSLIGKRPAIVRPPYGNLTQPVIDQISKNNYKIALWSIDTVDWSKTSKGDIIKNVINNIRPGDIISMHSTSDKRATLEALPEIIRRLRGMGYEFMTLDELLGIKAYK